MAGALFNRIFYDRKKKQQYFRCMHLPLDTSQPHFGPAIGPQSISVSE